MLIMAVLTIIGYAVWVAAYHPTPYDRLQGADPDGATACQDLSDWLADPSMPYPVYHMELIGWHASLATTADIRATAGLVASDARFADLRQTAYGVYRQYGYNGSTAYADDLATLDRACSSHGLRMPDFHPVDLNATAA
ncbi:hypothetical protein Afil01_25250 [Actinorhabdospora filicis]|uniref:Uncharacterized protein n=1 Tax=Actinorhabdospora filicis TaxID=1785913 RepID=A0A9W6SK53_9ACTN|nr:hypothetical protein Afil01_25250 [Actinorhabdospora filicis]